MDEGNKEQMLQAPALVLKHNRHAKHQDQWMIMEGDEIEGDIYNTSSSFGNSSTTNGSTSSSSDLVDDASSPTSTLSTSSSNSTAGPLFELSELMAHLPIKRGLSSFYQGKSQSFTSLSRYKKERRYHEFLIKKIMEYELVVEIMNQKQTPRTPFYNLGIAR
ncbi:conserved hypothetical protein [Ricinus communis]|uniref:Uncharacterized protein n=1 Tax=Ricinus communis TaxID=3988 RepID=B9RQD4_RICCO|nr:conserved hypothetical protein [Ricinus communis]